jgi:hypothetical protein
MTVIYTDGAIRRHRSSGLTEEQFALVSTSVHAELGDLIVQFRHATPFTPIRQRLRERTTALRAVLADQDVTPAHLGTVVEVLTGRAARRRTQRFHCDTPQFARELRAEESALLAITDLLHKPTGS